MPFNDKGAQLADALAVDVLSPSAVTIDSDAPKRSAGVAGEHGN